MTPRFEHYEAFGRAGETTDVVRKEMYDFVDRGGRRLALRPEGTAPVVRAFVQHRPPTPWKVWYLAPNFRAEQPQAGRYRQHWQLGAEVIGIDDPDVDVEVIELLWGFCRDLGLRDLRLLVNSMGDAETRARYREVLLAYWRAHSALLGDEMERAEANPLRILDSKRADGVDLLSTHPSDSVSTCSTPRLGDLTAGKEGLQELGIPFEIAPSPSCGMDRLRHRHSARAGERRTRRTPRPTHSVAAAVDDRLVQERGRGPAAQSIGFGSGIERLVRAVRRAEGVAAPCPWQGRTVASSIWSA